MAKDTGKREVALALRKKVSLDRNRGTRGAGKEMVCLPFATEAPILRGTAGAKFALPGCEATIWTDPGARKVTRFPETEATAGLVEAY